MKHSCHGTPSQVLSWWAMALNCPKEYGLVQACFSGLLVNAWPSALKREMPWVVAFADFHGVKLLPQPIPSYWGFKKWLIKFLKSWHWDWWEWAPVHPCKQISKWLMDTPIAYKSTKHSKKEMSSSGWDLSSSLTFLRNDCCKRSKVCKDIFVWLTFYF
jgi:hypothetical protein